MAKHQLFEAIPDEDGLYDIPGDAVVVGMFMALEDSRIHLSILQPVVELAEKRKGKPMADATPVMEREVAHDESSEEEGGVDKHGE